MANTRKDTISTRQIAILAADGVDGVSLSKMKAALEAEGAQAKVIAPHGGVIKNAKGADIKVDQSFLTAASVLFDAVFIPGGERSTAALINEPDAIHFINESYKHCKAIAADAQGANVLKACFVKLESDGVITGGKALEKAFIRAIAQHRFWAREKVPA
jgi:catalase